MIKWKELRCRINRDDGKYYQIGNRNLGALEIAGYFFLVISIVVYLLHDKAGLTETWIGWVALVFGFVFLLLGIILEGKFD